MPTTSFLFISYVIVVAMATTMCNAASVQVVASRKLCAYDNVTYEAGEKFRPDACTFCQCPRHGGRPQCAIQDCQSEPDCVQMHKEETDCCGTCLVFGCLNPADGRVYFPGAPVSDTPCERCHCHEYGRRLVCVPKVECEQPRCVDAIQEEGDCCFTCPKGPNCWLEGKVLPAGKVVQLSGCRLCQCPKTVDKNGRLDAVCSIGDCS